MDADYPSSLQRRLRAVHSLYDDASATMMPNQGKAATHASALPIALSLVHQLLMDDGTLVFIGGPPPPFNEEWAERLDLAIADTARKGPSRR